MGIEGQVVEFVKIVMWDYFKKLCWARGLSLHSGMDC